MLLNKLNITRADFIIVFVLWMIALAIYFPVFYSAYIYTDEIVQLWLYKEGADFHMFMVQGRYITDILFDWLFSKAHTIDDVKFIRLFSLGGWLLVIPVWYYIIRKISIKEGLPNVLAGFSVLYLICTPVFSISITWASCLELFIANTAGLLSGYFLYKGISYEKKKISVSAPGIFGAVLFGMVSLFTYQNGFGCFLLPFLLHLLAHPGKWKMMFVGVVGYVFICLVYYIFFKYQLKLSHVEASTRTAVHINVLDKIKFFFTRPMAGSFHFTYLVNEKSIPGVLVYLALFGLTIAGYRLQLIGFALAKQAKQIGFIILLSMLIYLPGLIVKENYASNRTLLALNMAVFFFAGVTLLTLIRNKRKKQVLVSAVSTLFICNALYNLHIQFLKPLVKEYALIRKTIEMTYRPGTDTVFFVRPLENAFVKRYGITRSWDEFGVPSTFFEWVPEFIVRQVVFEKTGDRILADKLVVKNWLGTAAYLQSGEKPSANNNIFINAEAVLAKP